MNNYGYIYKTTNLVNSKIYIGRHKGEFDKNYLGSGVLIKREIPKDSLVSFKVELVAYGLTKEQLYQLEKKYIEDYKEIVGIGNLYNIRSGGSGGFTGKKHSLDTISKIRNSVKIKMATPEVKVKLFGSKPKMSESIRNKWKDPIYREKCSKERKPYKLWSNGI